MYIKQKINSTRIVPVISGRLLIVFFVLISCNQAQKDPHKKKTNYRTIEHLRLEECSVYAMIFDRGKYAFRFALSGPCHTLTKDVFLEQYKSFLQQYSGDLNLYKGQLIRLDFYKEKGIDTATIESIVLITSDLIKKQAAIQQVSDDDAILEIR